MLHPADMPLRNAPLVGAPAVYAELRGWLADLQDGRHVPALVPTPEASAPPVDGVPVGAAAASDAGPGA
jgi:hypothetical protein